MAFLALTLLSLYEPREDRRAGRCLTHPLRARPYTRSEVITYTADMNIALAYTNAWTTGRTIKNTPPGFWRTP